MKFFVVAAVLACAALVIAHPASDEHKDEMKKAWGECVVETGVDEDVVKKACGGDIPDDVPKLPEFYLCFSKKSGFMNDAGEYQIKRMKTKLTEKFGEEFAEKYISECTKESHGSAKDNAFNLAKCFHQLKKDIKITKKIK